jgi:hypothetical protein
MLGISIEGFDDVMVCPVVGDKGIIAWAEAESTLGVLGAVLLKHDCNHGGDKK